MNLFIFNNKINIKFFVKKENNFYWKNKNTVYLIAGSSRQTVLFMTEILNKYKITRIVYLGFAMTISNDIYFNDVFIVKKAYNTMVDLSAFGYKIGLFPNEEDNKKISDEKIKKFTNNIPDLKIAKVGSSNIDFNNKYYYEFINSNFSNKFKLIDKLSGSIFFTGKKFKIDDIFCFLFVNANKYDNLDIQIQILINYYNNIQKILLEEFK